MRVDDGNLKGPNKGFTAEQKEGRGQRVDGQMLICSIKSELLSGGSPTCAAKRGLVLHLLVNLKEMKTE